MDEHEYAGFWIRVTASIIDTLIVIIFVILPLLIIFGEKYELGEQGFFELLFFFLNYITPLIVTIWFWLHFFGTPGKMVTKLKIVDAKTGNKLSLKQAIGRHLAYIPSSLPLGLGLIWMGMDKKKQGWHDKLAGTVVIKDLTEKQPTKNFYESPSIY
ncbi:MAG: RDD family protein [Methylococcales bacterium]|nr:RDD family protein [Methylococcales bacterium]